MLRLPNISLPLDYTEATMKATVAAKLRVPPASVQSVTLVKRSVDARDKGDVHFVATLDVAVANEAALLKKARPGTINRAPVKEPLKLPQQRFTQRPVVVGAGPAGLFAALMLARAGANPILLERGKAVEERSADVAAMQEAGILLPESNVQFGEGGAGAFSDGKLTTGIKSPYQATVLETFVEHGAP